MKPKIEGLQFIINTDSHSLDSCFDLALKVLLGGVDSIQFRHKGIYSREMYAIAIQLVCLCRCFAIPLIVNDRVDIALAIKASGVHLGQADLPLHAARKLLGNGKIIGVTASSLEQAKQAETEGADYVGFGHVYPTATKIKQDPPTGLTLLEQVCKALRIPILAIGGINEKNIAKVCFTGVSGIAVVSAIGSAIDPLNQTQKLKKLMASHG